MTAYVPPLGSTSFSEILRSLLSLASGRSNATGAVTLTPSAATTTVTDQNCAQGAAIQLSANTANAAAALGGCYFTTSNGSFVIHHASNSQTDRTFTYAIIG